MKKLSSLSMQEMEELLQDWGSSMRQKEEKMITPDVQARFDTENAFLMRVIREKRWDLLEERSREICAKLGIPNRTAEEILALTDDRPTASWDTVMMLFQEPLRQAQGVFFTLFRHPAFAGVALSILLVFGGSFFALAKAKSSLPGQSLYTVKLAYEEAKISLSWDEETKAKLELLRVKERAKEVQTVVLHEPGSKEEKQQRVQVAVERLKAGLSNVSEHVKTLEQKGEKEKVAAVALATEDHGKEVASLLADTEVQLPKDVNGEVRSELRAALEGVNAERIYVLTFLHTETSASSATETQTQSTEVKENGPVITGEKEAPGGSVVSDSSKIKKQGRTVEISPGISVFTNFAPSVFNDPSSNPTPSVFSEPGERFGYSVFSDPNIPIE